MSADRPDLEQSELELYADADAVAAAIADRLTERLAELQRERPDRMPQVALTGGRVATKAYQQLALRQAQDTDGGAQGTGGEAQGTGVDWSRVELWWGDERFVAADSDDRNDRGALEALVPALPLVEAHIHRMPADDGVIDVDDAARIYAEELGDTRFDICLLGVGPDGHVASLFPDHPDSEADGTVTAVRDSPKPPPLRTSLTRSVINNSREVWFTVAGADKADAVRWALLGERPVPAAQVRGTDRSLWLLDEAATAELPKEQLPG